MRKIRAFAAAVVAFFLLAGGGCDMTPADRVAMYRQTLEKAEPILAQAEQRTIELQAALDQSLAFVADNNAPMEERQKIWQTLAKIRSALPAAIEYEQRARTLVEQTRLQIEALQAAGPVDSVGESQVIGGAAGGILASLPPPFNALAPFAVPVAAVVGWCLTWLRARKVKAAASAIVAGVEAAPAASGNEVKAAIKTVMDVRGIRNEANAVVDSLKAA